MMTAAHALVFVAVAAASGGHCPGATASVGGHIPGGGFKGESTKNVVTSISKVFAPSGTHIGYLYHTGSGRDVFASRIMKAGTPEFARTVKLYTSEGFPNDDAESLVDAGPPILMWLPNTATFFGANHLSRGKCD